MSFSRAFALSLLLLFAAGSPPLSAQPIGTWKSYTSQTTILGIEIDESGRIWSGSEGGLFYVDNGEIAGSLTPTEGMYRINPRTMYYNAENNLLWMGYNDGTFEAYDPVTEQFREYTDIARATRFSPRGINQFVTRGDDLLIATDFGIVLFEPEREITRDTYSNLGDFPSGGRVNAVLYDEEFIYAATPAGVAVADITGTSDLVVPDSWTAYGSEAGFDANVTELVVYQGDVIAQMGNSLLRYDGASWEFVTYFDGETIDQITSSDDHEYLVAWNETRVMVRYPDNREAIYTIPEQGQPVNSVTVDVSRDRLLVGTTNLGIRVKNLQDGTFIEDYLPAGPYMNSFSDLVVSDGVLASGSDNLHGRVAGIQNPQSGYYIFKNNEWHNFNNLTHPVLGQRSMHSIYTTAATSDYFFFGSWGRGVVQHDRETDDVTIWDSHNSVLDGFEPGSTWIVASGLTTDRHENLWVVSRLNPVNSVYRFVPETDEWTAFPRLQGLAGSDSYESVMVDSHDQIWLSVINDRNDGRGLVVKRVDGDEIADGVRLTDEGGSGNLPHPMVNAIAQDRRGEIWVGTSRGLARFAFPQRVIDGGASDRQASLIVNADETADSPFLLRTSNVTSIVVNSANQKWIGTDGEGVWLIEEDGGRHRAVRNFTTDNSPLVSNSITSLAYDDVTGQVYIATDLGMVSYTDVVRGSVAEMDDLFIYPNPFSYNRESSERVVIDRLSEQTTVRILTVDGRLVRRLETRGGRVEWDVRDFKGDRVSTGVYIIVSVDDQNDQRGVGKLVVVR